MHDDLVERDFTATGPNRLWLTHTTGHPAAWIPVIVATPMEALMMGGPIYSEEQRERFFEILDRGGTVRAAARSAGVSEHAAYRSSRGSAVCDGGYPSKGAKHRSATPARG